MSESDSQGQDGQDQQSGPDDVTQDDAQDTAAPESSEPALGAGTTEGADSFGPTDVETDFEGSGAGSDGSDADEPPAGESDSAFGGETGEFGDGEDATTDGNTSAGDSGVGPEEG